MTNDEAEKLASNLQEQLARDQGENEPSFKTDIQRLCDYILSGDHKREIKNAALERCAVQFDRLGCVEAAKTIRSLIQPAAQKDERK